MPEIDDLVIASSSVFGALLLWWVMCRGAYMTDDTRWTDRLALIAIGAASAGYVCAPLLFAGEVFLEPLLLAGVTAWVGLPTARKWLDRRREKVRNIEEDLT